MVPQNNFQNLMEQPRRLLKVGKKARGYSNIVVEIDAPHRSEALQPQIPLRTVHDSFNTTVI